MGSINRLKNCWQVLEVENSMFNGAVPRDFRLPIFSWISFPHAPDYPIQFFSKILWDIRSSRCTNGVVDAGGILKKSSLTKVLKILYGPIGVVELNFCLQFHFKV
jgi:hypothetical protein